MALLSALLKISVTTTVEAADAVAECLGKVFCQPASTDTRVATGRTLVSVYCDTKPRAFSSKCAALCDGLRRIKSCGLDIGSGRIRIQKVPRQDWAESWKRHFQPLEIGKALLIKPSWSKRRPCAGQAVVILDPGLSFGTGQHPTTEFCLRALVASRIVPERGRSPSAARESRESNRKLQRPPASQPAATGDRSRSFLDIGTGSGILAIAAAKLGYTPVHAFDFDPEAVRVARSNARANGVSSQIQLSRADVTKFPRRLFGNYDIVCANLISTLLIAERRTIAALIKPGGLLVLAGILKSEFHEVQTAYESLGLRLVASRTEKEWRSGSFGAARHFNSRSET